MIKFLKSLSYLFIICFFFNFSSNLLATEIKTQEKLYGITIDDSWYDDVKIEDIIDGIKNLPIKPVVRIVMSKDIKPKDYISLFSEVHKVAYIMAQPVDSFEMNTYKNVESYKKRFEDSYKYLKDYVDIWEIGKEVNGQEWIKENPKFTAKKIYSAYKFIKSKNGITALTPYYFPPEENKISMENWLKKYIPNDMKNGLDYVFISYYEDDNDGFQPKWKDIFINLEKIFPNSKLGIGECGNTSQNATKQSKIKMINHYYSMTKYTTNYVGGYFWWYWVQDCIPYKNNEVWLELSNNMKN